MAEVNGEKGFTQLEKLNVTDTLLVNGVNVEDEHVKWLYPWVDGEYPKSTMTRIADYTAISNKQTSDYPVPVQVGSPEFLMDGATFATQSNVSSVGVFHLYEFIESGEIRELRIYIPAVGANIDYTVIAADITNPNAPTTNITKPINLTAGQWNTIALTNNLVLQGTRLLVELSALNSSSTTPVTGGWSYGGVDNNNLPLPQSWNRNNQDSVVRINIIDLDSVNRETELLGMIEGTTITFVETLNPANFITYTTVGAPFDAGDSVTYDVIVSDIGGAIPLGVTTTMNAAVPIPSSTSYSVDAGFWSGNQPSFAVVTAALEFDGAQQPSNETNGFGIDISFQRLSQSEDWDIVSIL